MKRSDNLKESLQILYVLTASDLKARYRNTFAGFFWVIINPIVIFLAHALIFKYVLKINIENYFIFLLSGILPWIFISSTLNMGIGIFIQRGNLLKSFKINPFILLWSKILDNFINFIIAFFIILVFLLFKGNFPSSSGFIFTPFALLILLGGTFSMLYLASMAQVFYRDIAFINQFVMSLAYLLTPVFYPESMIPASLKWTLLINPFYAFIRPFQICIYQFNFNLLINSLFQGIFYIFIFSLLGFYFWRKRVHDFYLRI